MYNENLVDRVIYPPRENRKLGKYTRVFLKLEKRKKQTSSSRYPEWNANLEKIVFSLASTFLFFFSYHRIKSLQIISRNFDILAVKVFL